MILACPRSGVRLSRCLSEGGVDETGRVLSWDKKAESNTSPAMKGTGYVSALV